jgi:hypothetical protein
MHLRRRIRRRRAISAIVSSLLLIVATGIIGSYLVFWANSSFALQSLNISTQSADRINLIKESYVIEDVWFKTGPASADITVRNTGDLGIKISRIYMNSTKVWEVGQTIAIGNYATINVVLPVAPGTNKPQTVWIITERGTEAKQAWKS